MRRFACCLAIFTLAVAVMASDSAQTLVDRATKAAKAKGKNVLVLSHASWCGWCHRMEAFLNDSEMKPLFDRSLEIVWLTIQESPEHKADENEGGDAFIGKLGGDKAGLPFFAILDSKGKMLVNSLAPKTGNTGYPAAPAEIAYFITMLEKGAPKLSASDRTKIASWLTAHAPKAP